MVVKIFRTLSLKARLIIIYTFIVGAGGLITSFIGSLIVNQTIMNQAEDKVHHDLKTARMVYENQLSLINQNISARAGGSQLQILLKNHDHNNIKLTLEKFRKEIGLDFITITDPDGRVNYRSPTSSHLGDDLSDISLIKAALAGKQAASTEIFSNTMLHNENPELAAQAMINIISTPRAKPIDKTEETSGMVLIAASPIMDFENNLQGVLYGGHLLNRNYQIVDKVWELVYSIDKSIDQSIGAVTIFLKDLRISTNLMTDDNQRAIGTRVAEDVYNAVLVRGEEWADRAFIVSDWYISNYEPIKNQEGENIGILYVGLLEKVYLAIRNRVISTFIGVASIGFILIIYISYLLTKSITRPLGEMVEITQSIATGDLNREVLVSSTDEIGKLGASFNIMVRSLRIMREELEDWAKNLELKVKQRTEELKVMQEAVIQTERLASLGKMAAGIAHEINNPLGGILVLSSLALENLDKDDPNRPNLEEVVNQTIRCRDIVKGLLQFSRQTEPKMSMVKISDLLEIILSLLEKQALFHNIDVDRKYHPNLPFVMVDQAQFQQVFINILLNAVQAMNEIGTLTLETDYNEDEKMVIVNITDTGSGIPTEIINKIFDPFFTTKDVGQGTGLGLSIAYGIVTRHNGKMSVQSKINEGTTFTIQIPVAS